MYQTVHTVQLRSCLLKYIESDTDDDDASLECNDAFMSVVRIRHALPCH